MKIQTGPWCRRQGRRARRRADRFDLIFALEADVLQRVAGLLRWPSRALALVLFTGACAADLPPSPPPPPPPRYAHCPSPISVYFDYNSADLEAPWASKVSTSSIRRTLTILMARSHTAGEFSCAINPNPTTRRSFYVVGHTDRSPAEATNTQLALLRAKNVADYLVELGVPREYICVRSAGSGRLLVRAEGREPQNRRVEINIELLKPGELPCSRPPEYLTSPRNF